MWNDCPINIQPETLNVEGKYLKLLYKGKLFPLSTSSNTQLINFHCICPTTIKHQLQKK